MPIAESGKPFLRRSSAAMTSGRPAKILSSRSRAEAFYDFSITCTKALRLPRKFNNLTLEPRCARRYTKEIRISFVYLRGLRGSRFCSAPSEFAQALGGDFGCDVALRGDQHFEADHELADRRRTQQRWIEMRVKVALGMIGSIGRRLVKSHGVGEGHVEDSVVGRGDALQDIAQPTNIFRCESVHAFDVT